MKYVYKKLADTISVTDIINVHYFEFNEDFYTEGDKHPFYELVFVAGGSLNIKSENFEGVLGQNNLIIHSPDEYHSLSCEKNVSPDVIIIGFTCTGGELKKFSTSPLTLTDEEVKTLAEIIKEGRNVFAPPYNVPVYDMKKKEKIPYGAEQLLKILLEYFLIGISRKNLLENDDDGAKYEIFSAKEIVNYIDNNYLEKITLDELAFIFRTNRSTLCKTFKEYTGNTVIGYINDKKIRLAKKKINTTSKTFTEIAEELNFESIHYFTRFFKKMTGVSPNEYRKSLK